MVKLDSPQSRVAALPYSESSIVIAGPGTGKTTTSVQKLLYFESQFEDSESEVLYFSFSNAAVEAAFGEDDSFVEELSYFVETRTLDGFAADVLRHCGVPFTSETPHFDSRVDEATNLINSGEYDAFGLVKHVIIDEAQDIYGIRRQLVLAIIKSLPSECGITIFADPLQSIYGFQEANLNSPNLQPPTTDSWSDFCRQLQELREFKRLTLTNDYRSESRQTRNLSSLLAECRAAENQIEVIDSLEEAMVSLVSYDENNLRFPNSGAILFRTNADSIYGFQVLSEKSKNASLLMPPWARNRSPKWMIDLIVSSAGDILTNGQMLLRSLEELPEVECPAHLIDDLLLHEHSPKTVISRLLAEANTPFRTMSNDEVRFCTVHQAKGLEFQDVLVHNPEQYLGNSGKCIAEPELLYVALSRGIHFVGSLELPVPRFSKFPKTNRVLARLRKNGRPHLVSVYPSDIEVLKNSTASLAEINELCSSDNPKAEFQIARESFSYPTYEIRVNGEKVARTNREFGLWMVNLCGPKLSNWPQLSPIPIVGCEPQFLETDRKLELSLRPQTIGFAECAY